MLNSFDYRDGLRHLFTQKSALKQASLEILRGKKIAIGIPTLVRFLGENQLIFALEQNFQRLKYCLEKYDISMTVVFCGIDVLNFTNSHSYAHSILSFIEKSNLLVLLSRIVAFEDSKSHEDWKIIHSIYTRAYESFAWSYFFQKTFHKEITTALYLNNIPHVSAVQSLENELTLMIDNKIVDAIFSEALPFWIYSTNICFTDISIDNESVEYLDLGTLAQSYNCEQDVFRQCLLGSFLAYAGSKDDDETLKQFRSTITKFLSYFHNRNAIITKTSGVIDNYIRSLVPNMNDSSINDMFFQKIENILGTNRIVMEENFSYHTSSPFIQKNGEIKPHAICGSVPHLNLTMNSLNTDIYYLYHNNYIEEELFCLLNPVTKYSAQFFTTTVNSPGVEFYGLLCFRQKIEKVIGCVFKALKLNCPEKLEIRLDNGRSTTFSTTNKCFSKKYIDLPTEGSCDLLSYLLNLSRKETANTSIKRLNKETQLTFSNLSNLIVGNMLNSLGYLNLESEELLVPGLALLKVGPCEFVEELVMIFELFRYGFMSPYQYACQRADGETNENVLSNNLFDLEAKNYIEVDSEMLRLEDSDKSSIFAEKSVLSSFYLGMADSDEHLFPDSPKQSKSDLEAIRISVEKCLNNIYFNIKVFQVLYVEKSDNVLASLVAEDIIKSTTDNNAFGYATIISRFLCFVRSDYFFADSYDTDLRQLRDFIYIIRKTLHITLQCNLFSPLAKNNSIRNKTMIEKVEGSFPFTKMYSFDAGTVVKTLLVQFLLLQELLKRNDQFASTYRKRLEISFVTEFFGVSFDFIEFLDKGRLLLNHTIVMVEAVRLIGDRDDFEEDLQHLKKALDLLDKFIDFFNHK